MSTIQKLIAKFWKKPIPNDITLDEVVRLADYYGCKVIPGGKHPVKIAFAPLGKVIPIPMHGSCVQECYIKELKSLFESIEGS